MSSDKIPNVGIRKIRHYQTVSDDVHEQEISVTCELNNRIIKLKNEIERLYNSLTRLDTRFNRDRRGLYETTTIVDCVQMKGKFNKIYEDLNRISKALSMIDNNGICRCKCPLDTITIVDTTTEVTRLTEIPFDIITFASGNLNEHITPSTSEKTKLLKKNTISNNKPQSITNQFRSISDHEIITTTSDEENEFTTVLLSALGDTTTQGDTGGTIDTKGDLSPEMSNAVTNSVKLKDDAQITVEPQILYHTETITNDYINLQTLITSDMPTSSTDITDDSNETIQTTELNNNKISTAQEKETNKDVILKFTTESEDIPESTSEILELENNHSNTFITIKTPESTFGNRNISKFTSSTSEPDNNYNIAYTTEKTSQSTPENENILGSTAEILELDNNYRKINVKETTWKPTSENENTSGSTIEISELDNTYSKTYVTEKTSESTFENENISESTTEILILDNSYSKTYIIEKTSESTTKIENIFETITVTSKPNDNNYNNYSNTNVTEKTVDLIIENKNITESITEMSISNKNDEKTIVQERNSLENHENDENKRENGQNTNQSTIIGNTGIENLNHSEFNNKDDDKSTPQQPEVIQQQLLPKSYPICFYPVPCSPNIVSYQQNEQDTNKNTIQYSAQSLNAYKRKPPVATVIQNNYPVLLICRTDVVCSVTDFAGQSNRLHCMYSVNASKNNEYTSNQTIKNYDNSTKNTFMTRTKSARSNDDILTGNKI